MAKSKRKPAKTGRKPDPSLDAGVQEVEVEVVKDDVKEVEEVEEEVNIVQEVDEINEAKEVEAKNGPTENKPQSKQNKPHIQTEPNSQTIIQLQQQIELLTTEKEDLQEEYDDFAEKVAHLKTSLAKRLKADTAEIASLRSEKTALQDQISSLTSENSEISARVASIEQEKTNLENKLSAEEASLLAEKSKLASEESRHARALTEARGELDAVKARFSSERQSLNSRLEACESAQKRLTAVQGELTDANETIEVLKAQFSSANDELERERQCSKQQRELASEAAKKTESERQQLNQNLETAHANEASLRQENEQLANKIALLTEREAATSARIAGLEEEAALATTLHSQVREKDVQLGKLQHEAIILNEHLTKALHFVKRDSQSEKVDKELISNLFVRFATIPRGDTKKFEVLQLISSYLGWDEDTQVLVGLSRQHPRASDESSGGLFGRFAEFLDRESRR